VSIQSTRVHANDVETFFDVHRAESQHDVFPEIWLVLWAFPFWWRLHGAGPVGVLPAFFTPHL
jgi:hypothetical protein